MKRASRGSSVRVALLFAVPLAAAIAWMVFHRPVPSSRTPAGAPSGRTATRHGDTPTAAAGGSGERRVTANGFAIEGRVISSMGGSALSGVVLMAGYDEFAAETTTNAQGEFTLRTAQQNVVLRARRDGYGDELLVVSAPSTGVVVVMRQGAAIRGRVVTGDEKAPAAGTMVFTNGSSTGGASVAKRAPVNDDGTFELADLPPGEFWLQASGPSGRSARTGPVALMAGEGRGDLRLVLVPGYRVEGRVLVVPGEQECGDAQVQLSSAQDDATSQPGVHGIVLDGVPAGSYSVSVRCKDVGTTRIRERLEISKDVAGLTWRVERGGVILGTVKDDAGKAVTDVRVSATDASSGSRIVTPDEGGSFAFRELAAGKVTVTVTNPGHSVALASESLTIDVGTERRLALVVGGGGLRVHVVGEDRKPVTEGVVTVEHLDTGSTARARIDAAGEASWRRLPAGSYSLAFLDQKNSPDSQRDDGERGGVTVQEGTAAEATLVVRVHRGVLTGVVEGESHDPVSNARVSLAPAQSEDEQVPLSDRPSVLTDGRGRFEFTGLAQNGSFAVHAEAPSGATARKTPVSPGQRLTLTVSAETYLRGTLEGGGGEAVEVRARSGFDQGQQSVTVAENTFSLRVAKGIQYELVATSRKGHAGFARVTVNDAVLKTGVRIQMAGPGAVTGIARLSATRAPAGLALQAGIQVTDSMHAGAASVSVKPGEPFRLASVPPGDALLRVAAVSNGRVYMGQRKVRIEPDKTVDVGEIVVAETPFTR